MAIESTKKMLTHHSVRFFGKNIDKKIYLKRDFFIILMKKKKSSRVWDSNVPKESNVMDNVGNI